MARRRAAGDLIQRLELELARSQLGLAKPTVYRRDHCTP